MKFISLMFQILCSLFLVLVLIYWLSAYSSAFEADRACHSLLINYQDKTSLGCDHDTETHKWILYENKDDGVGANVIKRFRYHFL